MSFASTRARALSLFALAALVRMCFWLATPDRALPNSIAYEGDTPKWLSFLVDPATNVQLALPMHPPGMIWLTPWLTDGEAFGVARFAMALLGSLLAPMLYLFLRRGFSERVALLAGLICAVSSSLVVVGSGLHSEVPYLVMFALGLFPYDAMRRRQSYGAAVWFGLTQGLACFLRVDHLAFVVLALAWLAIRSRPHGRGGALVAAATIVIVFLPWQGQASALVARANTVGFPGQEPESLPLANSLEWDEDALVAVRNMPAFSQVATFAFVNNTVKLRGGKRVMMVDLEILDGAFGSRPEALSTPLLALYGPMNFALANYPEGSGGFSREALDHRPPLVDGLQNYSSMIQVCLQPNAPLMLSYPPHNEILNHGYRLGLDRWWADPGWALSLMASKAAIAWRGAAMGVGSYNAPHGMSGVREAVDITVPLGWLATTWRVVLLVLALAGLWFARSASAVAPLLLFAASKLVAVLLFFGYARFGAMCVPSLAILWSVAIDRILLARLSEATINRLLWAFVVGVVCLEGVRCVAGELPKMTPDGVPSGPVIGRDERVFVNY